jgi:hypothetical protein
MWMSCAVGIIVCVRLIGNNLRPNITGMREYLQNQINERSGEIDRIDSEIAALQQKRTIAAAERRAYEDALGHLPELSADMRKHGRTGVRSGSWREVFKFIASRWPESVTNDQMMAHALEVDVPINRQSLRAQLSTYTQKGSLERLGEGVYRITSQGAAEIGIDLAIPAGDLEESEPEVGFSPTPSRILW